MAPTFSRVDLARQLYSLNSVDAADYDRAERTQDLLLQAVDADDTTKDRLYEEIVLLNIEVAESIAMRYRNRGVAYEDLVQVGCLGLVKAARGFDPEKSDNFLGYAVPTILGEVKRFFRDNAWVIRPPRRLQEMQAQISAAAADWAQATGRMPTPSEIADQLNENVSEVNEALAADGCFAPSSLDRTTTEDGATLSDVLGESEGGFDRAEAVVALRPLCRRLSERDRRIIYLRFFHEWTQAKIAEEFGVTQMQISRLLNRILAQLRAELGSTGLPVDDEPQAVPQAS